MKQVRLIILCYLTLHSCLTQAQNNEQQYVGRYGLNDGVCLFADGQFLLFGYATAVFGRYTKQDNDIHFYPQKQDFFEVYGTHNPQIEEEQSRWQFIGFEEGETFAQFDQDSVRKVFNADANCFIYPYIKNHPQPVKNIVLWNQDEDSPAFEAFHFVNTAAYNDFVLMYNRMGKTYEDFTGRLEGDVLKLSNYGGDEGYKKEEEDGNWDEILDWKDQYAQAMEDNENSYTDDSTQLQYHKLTLQNSRDQPLAPSPLAKSSIFYTVCEGSLELWSPDTENAAKAEAPFPTDKPNGFYRVKALNRDVYAETPLEGDAVLSISDIQSAIQEFTPDGIPVVTVNLTAEGKEKLASFTGDHIGQYMAVVVNKTVLSIPRIEEQISGGSLQISGNFTVEEAQRIAEHLNGTK